MRLHPIPVPFYDPDSGPAPRGKTVSGTEELKEELKKREMEVAPEEGAMEAVEMEKKRAVRLFGENADFLVTETSIIGSNPSMCDFTVRETGQRYVSGRHCRVSVEPGGCYISDLGSANGTLINGKKIRVGSKAALLTGDRVRIGKTVLMVEEEEL